jgi:hypothetical protein
VLVIGTVVTADDKRRGEALGERQELIPRLGNIATGSEIMRCVCTGLVFLALTNEALAQQIEYVPGLRGPDGRPQYGLTVPGPYGPTTFVDPYRCQEVPKGCRHVIEHELGHARDLMRYGTTSEESANRQADWELGFGRGGWGYGPRGGWAGGGYWPPSPGGGWGAGWDRGGYWPPSPGGGWGAGWGGGGYWPPSPGGGWGAGWGGSGYWPLSPGGGWAVGWGGGDYWPPPPGGGWDRR